LKIFDFTKGHKGCYITSIEFPLILLNIPFNSRIKILFNGFNYHSNANLSPSKFNVDAICFPRDFETGFPYRFWDWDCIGSLTWARQMVKEDKARLYLT
jgi:hypothetical protein